MLVPSPLGEPDPVRRVEAIAAETAACKGSGPPPDRQRDPRGRRRSAPGTGSWPASGRSPHVVPGPPLPLYLAVARLLELFPVAAIMANITLAVAVFSDDGQLNLTAIADRDTCPDVEVFAQGVRGALDEPARSALVAAPRGGRVASRS